MTSGSPAQDPATMRQIDAYWRAANYLSVGQIYLMDNPLLTEPLAAEDLEIARGVRSVLSTG